MFALWCCSLAHERGRWGVQKCLVVQAKQMPEMHFFVEAASGLVKAVVWMWLVFVVLVLMSRRWMLDCGIAEVAD